MRSVVRIAIRTIIALSISLGVMALASPARAQSEATVMVDPDPAPAGEVVTITAYGFAPGEHVIVDFGGQTIGSGYADDEGAFESLGVVPADMPAGGHPLEVSGDLGSYGGFELTVVPGESPPTTTTTAAPDPVVQLGGPVQAGGTTVISGTGFRPDEYVTIEFGGMTVGHTVANQLGEWSLAIEVAATMPAGGHPLDVTGDAGSFLTEELVVMAPPPVPTVAPTTVPPTTTVVDTPSAPTDTGTTGGTTAVDNGGSGETASTAGSDDSGTTGGADDSGQAESGGTESGGTGETSGQSGSGRTEGGGAESGGETGSDGFTLGLNQEPVDRGFERDSEPVRQGGAGGVPWQEIGVVLALLALATAYAATRTRDKNCDPEHAAYNAAWDAYQKAKRASDYYEGEYEHYRGEVSELEGQLENPLPPPVRGYYGEGPEAEAEADRVFAEQTAEWEMLQERAERAQHNIDGAREAMDAARAERDEADAALDTARDALERARIALMDCEGCAPASPDETETGGATTTPPAVATGGADCASCIDGSTRVKTEEVHRFRVLAGDVTVRVPWQKWNRDAGATIGGETLGGLDMGQLEDLFSDVSSEGEPKTIGWSIPTETLTLKLLRAERCENGVWVDSGQTTWSQDRTPAAPITGRDKAKDPRKAARFIAEAQAELATLAEAAAEAAAMADH